MVRLTGLIALLSTVLGIALRAISIIWVTLKQVENRAKNACRFFISRMRTHTRVFYFARVRVGSNRGKIRQFPIIIHWPADQFSNKTQILNSQFPIPNSQLLVSNSWDKCRQIASTIAASAGELRAFIRANLIYRLGAPKVRQFGVRGVHQRQARLHLSTPAKLIGVLTVFLVSTLAGFIIQFTDQTPKPAYAAINEQLNFQARLYNASGGIASDGNYNLQFHIYSGGDGDPDTADETLEWTGSYLKGNTDGVDVANGYFNVQLGDSVSQVNTMADVDWDNSTLWLSINIGDTSSTGTTTCDTESEFDSNCGGDGEMDPFLRLTSVPYAFNSKYLGGRSSSQFAQLDPSSQQTGSIDISGTVNAAALNRTGGNLTLQTTTSGNIVINGAGTLDVQDAATFASTIGVTGTATFNGDVDLVLADTENLSVSNTVTGTNGVDLVSTVLTNNTTSGTQRIAVLQNAAGSGTTEALLVLDNADADTAVTTGLQVTSAAGTIGTAIDISDTEIGTGISLGGNDITGTSGSSITADTLIGTTQVQTPLLDTASAVALNIGTTNATSINLNENTTIAADKTLSLSSSSGNASLLNVGGLNSTSFNIDTSSGTGALRVSIGGNGSCTIGRLCVQQGLTGTGAGPFTNVYNLSTISKTEAATIYGQQIRVNDTSSSIAHTIYGLYVDNSTGTTNASATINSIFANVDSANAGNLLQLQSDSANVFTVSNTGATTIQNGSLTVGDSDSAGTIVLSDGSSNTGTIQLAALGSNEVYIFPDSDGSDTVCLLDLNNCATGGTVTLQNAYGNGNNITTTEADGDIEFDLADTTTDQDFVVDIQGTGNTIQFQDGGTAFATFSDGGKALFKPTSDATDVFRIQNTAGTSTVFNVDTTNTRITVNGASGDLANRDLEVVDAQVTTRLRVGTGSNYVDFQANGGQIYYGTARPTQTVTLIPEFPGASLWGDGTYNSGTMTSDFCSNETGLSVNTSICGSGHEHNYYAWTATDSGQAQDYDIYVRYQLPKDFGGFSASDTIKLFGWVTSTTSNYDKVELSLYDDGGNQCGSTTTINSSNTIWENTAMTGDETACTGIDADDAGDTITFKIKVYARNGGYARVGELSFSYYAKF